MAQHSAAVSVAPTVTGCIAAKEAFTRMLHVGDGEAVRRRRSSGRRETALIAKFVSVDPRNRI